MPNDIFDIKETCWDKMRTPWWRLKFAYGNLSSKIRNHRNTLKITTLERGWIDADYVLLHASFQILDNFLREECSEDGVVDWEYTADHRNAMAEMRYLDRWWKTDPLAGNADFCWSPSGISTISGVMFIDAYVSEYVARGWTAEDCSWIGETVDIQIAKTGEFNPYLALAYIEGAAMRRQNDYLKRLIDIRSYMWT